MIIIYWLLFLYFIIYCNEFKMFIILGFYDSKYGLYIYKIGEMLNILCIIIL